MDGFNPQPTFSKSFWHHRCRWSTIFQTYARMKAGSETRTAQAWQQIKSQYDGAQSYNVWGRLV